MERSVESLYSHLQRIDVHEGRLVGRGEQIGTLGNCSGFYQAHLHFEIRSRLRLQLGPGYADDAMPPVGRARRFVLVVWDSVPPLNQDEGGRGLRHVVGRAPQTLPESGVTTVLHPPEHDIEWLSCGTGRRSPIHIVGLRPCGQIFYDQLRSTIEGLRFSSAN